MAVLALIGPIVSELAAAGHGARYFDLPNRERMRAPSFCVRRLNALRMWLIRRAVGG